jgi:hypothetical protein
MAICEMVFEEVVNTVLGHPVPVGMFASRRPLTLQELRQFVFDILRNPSLKLEDDRCSKVVFHEEKCTDFLPLCIILQRDVTNLD